MNKTWLYWIIVASIIVGAYLLSFLLRKLIHLFVKKQSKVMNLDPTNFSFIKNSVSFVIFSAAVISIFYITPSLKTLGTALFASAGILAAVLGFASQKAFSNIISGIFILIFKPFRVNDTISILNNEKGIVEEITLRHTVIRNYENRRIVIPNAIISDDTIINSSLADERIKKFIEFGISYDSDVDLARKIIAEEVEKHPLWLDQRTDAERQDGLPAVITRVIGLGDFSVNIRAYAWAANNDNAFAMYTDVLDSVKKRFDKEGIEIPFPYRTLVFKNSPQS